MKRVLTTLFGLIAIGATLPSFAGPDWQVIEHGRKVKLENMQRAAQAKHTTPADKTEDTAPQQKYMAREASKN